VKAEQELSEMSYQMDEMSARLEEADGLTSAQVCAPLTADRHHHRHNVYIIACLDVGIFWSEVR